MSWWGGGGNDTKDEGEAKSGGGFWSGVAKAAGAAATVYMKHQAPDITGDLQGATRLTAEVGTFQTAMATAFLCGGVYTKGEENIRVRLSEMGCELVHVWLREESSSFGLESNCCLCVNHHQRRVYVVFRGSDTFHDWIVNFTAERVPFVPDVFVHKGIYQSLASRYTPNMIGLRSMLIGTMRDHPGYDLFVTGHSLGGGYASILYMMICKDAVDGCRELQACAKYLYTFAAPLVVNCPNGEAALHVAMRGITDMSKMYNFVNEQDMVPRLLGGEWQYSFGGFEAFAKYAHLKFNFRLEDTKDYHPLGIFYYVYLPGNVARPKDPPEADKSDALATWEEEEAKTPFMYPPGSVRFTVVDCTNFRTKLLELPQAFAFGFEKCVSDHSMKLYIANLVTLMSKEAQEQQQQHAEMLARSKRSQSMSDISRKAPQRPQLQYQSQQQQRLPSSQPQRQLRAAPAIPSSRPEISRQQSLPVARHQPPPRVNRLSKPNIAPLGLLGESPNGPPPSVNRGSKPNNWVDTCQ
eukprot:TRINITY_DN5153_c0_g1_i1.p1 TRINITY_DN5153_c0_g1~~TRINITY_DN5153_c0_g1_i1.p1  ORF type:complete len:523 (+),score=76.16 TRINITY_DN5153_c0_g1_i1:178-1746(+)